MLLKYCKEQKMTLNTKKELSDKELAWLWKKYNSAEAYEDDEEPIDLYDGGYSAEAEKRKEATYAKRMLKKYGYL